ncbi:MAG: conjugal transfer protein TraF [Deltaproteobacteria bacterium]|nr:conjugal transfer protein TraF [Deltaproteobacteria bacterium]
MKYCVFNIQVPTILMVNKENGSYFPVSTGVVALDDLELRIYRSVRLLKGEIQPKDWSDYEFQNGGIFDTQTRPNMPQIESYQ